MQHETTRPLSIGRLVPDTAGARQGADDKAQRLAIGRRLVETAMVVVGGTVAFEAALFYRLWAQFTASVPASPPLSWLYSLTGLLVKPFYRFDTVTPVSRNSTFEFPALIAAEAYLLIGIALVVFLLLTAGMTGAISLPSVDWNGEVAELKGMLGKATGRLRGGFATAHRIAERSPAAFRELRGQERWQAVLRTAGDRYASVDWDAQRRRLAAGLDRELTFASSGAGEAGLLLENGFQRAVRDARATSQRLAGRLSEAHRSRAAAVRLMTRRLRSTGIEYLKDLDLLLATIQRNAESRSGPRRRKMIFSPGYTRREFIQRVRPGRQS